MSAHRNKTEGIFYKIGYKIGPIYVLTLTVVVFILLGTVIVVQARSWQQNGDELPSQGVDSLVINGRVLTEIGRPVSGGVSLRLVCQGKLYRIVHTDPQGYFDVAMAGGQDNPGLSAADEVSMVSGRILQAAPSVYRIVPGIGTSLIGCELRASAPEYQPLTHTIAGSPDMGRIDVGILQLTRLAHTPTPTVSLASLLVPQNARKEFDKGMKDVRDNRFKSAVEHFEKAVAQYDKYAAAWNELGNFYSMSGQTNKARASFEKAMEADPSCAPSYIGLANLDLQNGESEGAVEAVGKALKLEPGNEFARVILAMADFNLQRFDEAEKNARELEAEAHADIPQLHAVLAEIYRSKGDSHNAVIEIHAYLKESPQGGYSAQMNDALQEIEKSTRASGQPNAQSLSRNPSQN